MKKIHLLLFLLSAVCILTVACQNKEPRNENNTVAVINKTRLPLELPDSLSSRRISFVLNLRKEVAARCWKVFAEKRTEGTFIYFNRDQSEIFFPTKQILSKIDNYKKFSEDYLLTSRTDTIPYHFELMISFDSTQTDKFYFDHPVQQFLSVEETGNFIPSVKSTEMWATMVIHEMFHHFQYNIPEFKEYGKSTIGILPFDSRDLARLCNEDEQFLKLIQSENDYLLEAIAENNISVRNTIVSKYLKQRANRIQKYSINHPDLERVENYYITQEGSARYLEYQSMLVLNEFSQKSNSPKIVDDPNFLSYIEFEDVDLKDEAFNYLTYAGPGQYHYALGFNMMRLLDKLKVNYKDRLFTEPTKGLHEYLDDYLNALP